MDILTPQNLTFGVWAISIVFVVFLYFKNPQINSEKTDALLSQDLKNLRADFANLRDNHVHTLDTKLDETNKNMNLLTIQVTRLSVIIEERIPSKKI